MRISFIIIGKNEVKNIITLIDSIVLNSLSIQYEIIYIDSNSEDNSVEVLKKLKKVKSYSLKSNYYSAALARNLGASKATGEYLFFLDGDMEIKASSELDKVLEYLDQNKKCLISGRLEEIVYNRKDIIIENKTDRYLVKNQYEILKEPGGYFVINRRLFEEFGGFDEKIKSNEELEFFSRLLKGNIILYRTTLLTCIHHDKKLGGSSLKTMYKRFLNKYYVGMWRALFSCVKNKCIKEYLSFSAGKWFVKSLIIYLINISPLALIFFIQSKFSYTILLTWTIVILINKKFSFKRIARYYIYNFFLLSSLFLILDKNIEYSLLPNNDNKVGKYV